MPEHCAPSQTTVLEGQGLKVKVHLSIEPSDGGGRDGRVAGLLSGPESWTAKASAVVCCHIWWRGFDCVHAKPRRHKRDKS